MTPKSPPKRSPRIFLSILRTLCGAVVMAALWTLVGSALVSTKMGLGLGLWSLIVGPVLCLLCAKMFFTLRFLRHKFLETLDLYKEKNLSREVLSLLFKKNIPRPRLWLLQSQYPLIFWIELSLWKTRQELCLSYGALHRESQQRFRETELVWKEISNLSVLGRKLRTLQMAFWMAALLPLDLILYLLAKLIELLRFGDIPPPAFWLQSLAWNLRDLWLGKHGGGGILGSVKNLDTLSHEERVLRNLSLKEKSRMDARTMGSKVGPVVYPSVWHSLSLGPWCRVSPTQSHPLWPVIVDSRAFLSE